MPTIREKNPSRGFKVDSSTANLPVELFIEGTNDESEVYELIRNFCPIFRFGLVRKSMDAKPHGGGVWDATVEYGTIDAQAAVGTEPENPEGPDQGGDGGGGDAPIPMGPNVGWDTTGGSTHITQSRSTIYRYTEADTIATAAAPGTGPDNKKAIGLTEDEVKGTDIIVPQFNWSITVKRADCTYAYMQRVWDLTGCVNFAKKFYGFPIGSVLYLGASASYAGSDQWEITHKFACQKKRVQIDVGGGIIVPEKLGWDYLWIGYKKEVVGGKLLSVPSTAYVERVYDSGNFDLLEIGA